MVGLVMSFNFFMAENLPAAGGSFVVALFFIFLMLRNIQSVKKRKREKEEKKNDS
jgi:large-conductance mechanosensitive channel